MSAERDMPGVTQHIDTIWTLYASLRAQWPVSTGLLFYDYTERRLRSDDLSDICAAILHHKQTWEYKPE